MHISLIALDNFRSWNHCVIDCNPDINVFYGNNGLGKTNIVEAIEVISTGVSHRTSLTTPLIKKGNSSATIRFNVNNLNSLSDLNNTFKNKNLLDNEKLNDSCNDSCNEICTYEVTLNSRGANRARINSGKSIYMRDVVGLIPSVSFTPRDQFLVLGDPSNRRTFLDQAGVLLISGYSRLIQEYKHIAKQRTALLKQLSNNSVNVSLSSLEIWTGRLIEVGISITKNRIKIIKELSKYFSSIISEITSCKQNANIIYNPSFEEVFDVFSDANGENNCNLDCNVDGVFCRDTNGEVSVGEKNSDYLFKSCASKISEHFQRIYAGEVARGCNLIGPHRDDFSIELDGFDARDFASNGESWTIALALKMSLFKALEDKNNQKPIIILDDVFSQLDESRRLQIVNFIRNKGQVFITVASLSDIPKNDVIKSDSFIDVSKLVFCENNFNNTIQNIDSNHKSIIDEVISKRNLSDSSSSDSSSGSSSSDSNDVSSKENNGERI